MTVGEVRKMVGVIRYQRSGGSEEPVRWALGPLTVVTATLHAPAGWPDWRVRRRVRQLATELGRLGVRRIVVPDDLPHPELLADFGWVGPVPFYRGNADVLALGCMTCKGIEPARKTVVLTASWLCPELRLAAQRLCAQVRGVSIQTPGEGADYADWLHRRYGMPVTPPEGAAVTVAFTPGMDRWGIWLPLYEGGGLPTGLAVEAEGVELPDWCGTELLAALWEQGGLPRERLRVTERGG